ncbi:nucleoside triphosphate pyrophosphohydrolase [Celeribacter baekdonensis]|jgi:nucleoside triphosphate diphosphatase|uniref:Nucleoside triphosphate pyrophosphohydrolase n=1 Tax=Celeribacter baekdonensis TaxID=875171 RepID=A0A2R4M1D3_9RHOB|nr:nucleoside triphosphate pyrophosphohydrolase [Celeribacter baekdonensis]AVW90909.1 nucleoside triphosphate pyrophosphohydrolase [Celeribacter baekdonensis]
MTQPPNSDPIHAVPEGIEQLLEIMKRLRDPQGGCPWDIEQDFATISPYTIEEAYEVDDAITRGDMADLKSELGDLLFQSVFQAQIAADKGLFDFHDVAKAISDKMISRHPHVFGDESNQKSPEQQTLDWEREKAAERDRRGETRVLDGVAMGLPALMRAQKLQKRAARVGFDWPDVSHVIDKIVEESAELVEARDTKTQADVVEEFGDLLFVVVNLGRHLGVDAEEALRGCNAKFTRRFNAVEDALSTKGTSPQDSDLAEMDALWDAVKASEKAGK